MMKNLHLARIAAAFGLCAALLTAACGDSNDDTTPQPDGGGD